MLRPMRRELHPQDNADLAIIPGKGSGDRLVIVMTKDGHISWALVGKVLACVGAALILV
jgi:hypothetical protein